MNTLKVLIILATCIFSSGCGDPEKTPVKSWEVKHFSDGSEQQLKTRWEDGCVTYIFTSKSDLHRKIIEEDRKSRALLRTQLKFSDREGFTTITASSLVSLFTIKGESNILEGIAQCSYEDYKNFAAWELSIN